MVKYAENLFLRFSKKNMVFCFENKKKDVKQFFFRIFSFVSNFLVSTEILEKPLRTSCRRKVRDYSHLHSLEHWFKICSMQRLKL